MGGIQGQASFWAFLIQSSNMIIELHNEILYSTMTVVYIHVLYCTKATVS